MSIQGPLSFCCCPGNCAGTRVAGTRAKITVMTISIRAFIKAWRADDMCRLLSFRREIHGRAAEPQPNVQGPAALALDRTASGLTKPSVTWTYPAGLPPLISNTLISIGGREKPPETNSNFSLCGAISGICRRQIGAPSLGQFALQSTFFGIGCKLFCFQ